MASPDGMKFVEYEVYCPKCKYSELKDSDDPCNECLTEPINFASVKPIKFEEK